MDFPFFSFCISPRRAFCISSAILEQAHGTLVNIEMFFSHTWNMLLETIPFIGAVLSERYHLPHI